MVVKEGFAKEVTSEQRPGRGTEGKPCELQGKEGSRQREE